jgi:hypothetical protein
LRRRAHVCTPAPVAPPRANTVAAESQATQVIAFGATIALIGSRAMLSAVFADSSGIHSSGRSRRCALEANGATPMQEEAEP